MRAKATTNQTKSLTRPRKVKVKVVQPRKAKEKARTNTSMQQDVVLDAGMAIRALARTLITRRSSVIQAMPIGSMKMMAEATRNLNQTKSLTWPRKVKVKVVRPRKVKEKARTKVRRRQVKAKTKVRR